MCTTVKILEKHGLLCFFSYFVVEPSLTLFLSSTRTGWGRVQRTKDSAYCIVQFLYSFWKLERKSRDSGIKNQWMNWPQGMTVLLHASLLVLLLVCSCFTFCAFLIYLYAKFSLVQKATRLVMWNNIHDWKKIIKKVPWMQFGKMK